MVSIDILPEIKRQISDLSDRKQKPMAVKMSNSTWEELCRQEMGVHFGDVNPLKCQVYGILVLIDNALPIGVARVYTDWSTASMFPEFANG